MKDPLWSQCFVWVCLSEETTDGRGPPPSCNIRSYCFVIQKHTQFCFPKLTKPLLKVLCKYYVFYVFFYVLLQMLSTASHGLHLQMEFAQLSWSWFSSHFMCVKTKVVNLTDPTPWQLSNLSHLLMKTMRCGWNLRERRPRRPWVKIIFVKLQFPRSRMRCLDHPDYCTCDLAHIIIIMINYLLRCML